MNCKKKLFDLKTKPVLGFPNPNPNSSPIKVPVFSSLGLGGTNVSTKI